MSRFRFQMRSRWRVDLFHSFLSAINARDFDSNIVREPHGALKVGGKVGASEPRSARGRIMLLVQVSSLIARQICPEWNGKVSLTWWHARIANKIRSGSTADHRHDQHGLLGKTTRTATGSIRKEIRGEEIRKKGVEGEEGKGGGCSKIESDWTEKQSQTRPNTHTHTHTHTPERKQKQKRGMRRTVEMESKKSRPNFNCFIIRGLREVKRREEGVWTPS